MDKILNTLEYDKVIKLLTQNASTPLGKELCESLVPSYSYEEINETLKETGEAVNFTVKYNAPPFSAIHDIRTSLKHSEIASMLSIDELLDIADTLRGTMTLKKYFENSEEPTVFLTDYVYNLYTNSSICDEIYRCIDNSNHISDHASSTRSLVLASPL